MLPRSDDPGGSGGRVTMQQTDIQISSCLFSFIHRVKGACYSYLLQEHCSVTPCSSGETLFGVPKFILIRKKLEQVSYVRNFCCYCPTTENRAHLFLLLKTKKTNPTNRRKEPHNPSPKQYQHEKFAMSHLEHTREFPEFL